MIKIICCDVDGTLVNDKKQITEKTFQWIRRAVNEKDVRFVIVSGRMLSGIRGYYDVLGIKGPASAYNGCALYDEDDNIIADHRLETGVANAVIDTARDLSMDLIFYDNNTWYMENTDCYTFEKKYPLYGTSCNISDLRKLSGRLQTNKLLSMDPDRTRLDRFEQELRKRGVDESKVFFYNGPDFLELMPAGFTKGTAVDDLAKYYNIPVDQIMALGDDYNDISMLDRAGLAVAMANSFPGVARHADYVTSSNNEDGVGAAIARFIFNETCL